MSQLKFRAGFAPAHYSEIPVSHLVRVQTNQPQQAGISDVGIRFGGPSAIYTAGYAFKDHTPRRIGSTNVCPS